MTLNFKSGTFTSISTTGSQSITGVGFQPKALLIFSSGNPSEDAYAASTLFGMALTDGTNSFSSSSGTTISSGKTDRRNVSAVFPYLTNALVATGIQSTITSLDSDGFTINISTNTLGVREYHFVAIGGTDVTNAKAGTFNSAGATGNQSITGVGFKPDFLILTTATAGTSTIAAGAIFGVGFAASPTSRAAFSVSSNTAATRRTWRYQRTNKCAVEAQFSATVFAEADLVSFDSDGFTINFSTDAGVSIYGYLALKGGKYSVGSFNANTATGNQSVTGVGFAPVGLMLASVDAVSATTVNTNNFLSGGMADNFSGTTGQQSFGANDKDNAASFTSRYDSKTHCFEAVTTTSTAAQTHEMEATVNSWDSAGFTLNWGLNTGTLGAIEILYVCFGNSAALVTRAVSETVTLAETIKRKLTPKLTGETLTLTESSIKRNITRKPAAEAILLAESILRKPKPNVAGETLSLVESIRRKPKPKVAAETILLAESIKRKPIRRTSESLTLTEAISRRLLAKRILSEGVTLTESISVHKLFKRAVSETVALAESILRKVKRPRSETISLTESISAHKVFKRAISETVALVEAIKRKPVKRISETIALAEAISSRAKRVISESLTLTEFIGAHKLFKRAVSEVVALAESIKRKPIRQISETVSLLESISMRLLAKRALSESLTLTESISAHKLFKRVVAESIAIAESLLRKVKRPQSESISLAESKVRKVIRPVPSITTYEDFSQNSTYTITFGGGNSPDGLLHNVFKGGGSAGVQFDAGYGQNVFFYNTQAATTPPENHASQTDTVSSWTTDIRIDVKIRTTAQLRQNNTPNTYEVAWLFFNYLDGNNLYDLLLKTTGVELGKKDAGTQYFLYTNSTPTMTIGSWNTWTVIIRNGNRFIISIDGTQICDVTDTSPISNYSNGIPRYVGFYCEVASCQVAYLNITPLENIALAESFKRKAIPKVAGETLQLTEAIARLARYPRTLVETITLTEAKTRKAIPRITGETITLTESLKRKAIRRIAESLTLLESVKKKVTKFVSDTLTLSESVSGHRIFKKTVSEAIALTDTVKRKITRKNAETLVLTESSIVRRIKRLASETISLTESPISAHKIFKKMISETMVLSESITKRVKHLVAIVESIALTESILRRAIKSISIQETITLVETIASLFTKGQAPPVPPSPLPGGFAGAGERKARPIPVRDYGMKVRSYVRDYTMAYRKRWKGLY